MEVICFALEGCVSVWQYHCSPKQVSADHIVRAASKATGSLDTKHTNIGNQSANRYPQNNHIAE